MEKIKQLIMDQIMEESTVEIIKAIDGCGFFKGKLTNFLKNLLEKECSDSELLDVYKNMD